jgi:flavin-dependent dehydrogenase
MNNQYDAIVVGARCAGSPTAMLLARKGYKVLLVDRASFPSDHISTHLIWPPGVDRLKRWGLLDSVMATGCPPVADPMTFDFLGIELKGRPSPHNGTKDAYAPRRTVLDKILVDAALAAGVELRENFTVRGLLHDGARVSGIRGQRRGGAEVTEQAKIVIGADGLHSVVAKEVEAPSYNERPPLECAYYTYWSGISCEGFEAHIRPHRGCAAIPTIDGLTLVLAATPVSEFHKYRSDIEGNYWSILGLVPSFAERVRQGKREERFVGTADVPNFLRRPYGPGWALVGDAGYHKDPVTAQGISDAFRDADALSEAIDRGFSGRQPLEEALAEYERARNDAVMPLYEFTCQLATLEPPPPEVQQIISALPGNQPAIDRFFGVQAGTVPVPEFFSPESVGEIMAAA